MPEDMEKAPRKKYKRRGKERKKRQHSGIAL